MKIITKNKRAYHDYDVDKTYEVGIVLQGHEAKSVKTSNVNISDAIVIIEKGELWILNMDIPLYAKTSPALAPNYQQKGKRKLLVTKRELAKISSATDKPGMVAIPLEVFLNRAGYVKLKIGIAKLMRKVEKKQILKEKDIDRQMKKDMKNY